MSIKRGVISYEEFAALERGWWRIWSQQSLLDVWILGERSGEMSSVARKFVDHISALLRLTVDF